MRRSGYLSFRAALFDFFASIFFQKSIQITIKKNLFYIPH
jgi:hypothetical protein